MSSVADIVELEEERSKRVPLTDSEFSNAGAMLKAAREALGHSIDDAHEATNVRPDYLEAIEEMNIGQLPIAAYTSGFVKAYAQFLELPDEALVARFRKEAGYETPSVLAPEMPDRDDRDLAGGRELSLLAVAAILFFVIWVAFQITRPPQDDAPIQPVELEGTPLQQRPIEEPESSFDAASETPADTLDTATAEAQTAETTPPSETPGQETSEPVRTPETETPAPVEVPEVAQDELAPILEEAIEEPAPAEQIVEDATALNAAQLAQPEETITEDLTELPVLETLPVEDTAASSEENLPEIVQPLSLPEVIEPVVETPVPAEPVLTEPIRATMVPPIYPIRCQRRAEDVERVTVIFDIDSQGRPLNQRVSRSSNACFDQASLNAIDRWTFEPATRNGRPVPAYGQSTTFVYNLPE